MLHSLLDSALSRGVDGSLSDETPARDAGVAQTLASTVIVEPAGLAWQGEAAAGALLPFLATCVRTPFAVTVAARRTPIKHQGVSEAISPAEL